MNSYDRSNRRHDLVTGPASDGDDYLIGVHRSTTGLFENAAWATSRVLEQTRAIAAWLTGGEQGQRLGPRRPVGPRRPDQVSLSEAAAYNPRIGTFNAA